MRISDWSSDVCSSDLICIWLLRRNDDYPQLFLTSTHTPYSERQRGGGQFWWSFRRAKERCVAELKRRGFPERARVMEQSTPHWLRHNFANCLRQVYGMDARGKIGRASCRERVCQYG